MKKLLWVFLLFVSFSVFSAENIEGNAKQLHDYTQKLLGISPKALAYLIQTSKGSYYPVEIYKQLGEYKYFEELERNGFIQIELVGGLPDGASGEAMAMLIPTKKGQSVKSTLVP